MNDIVYHSYKAAVNKLKQYEQEKPEIITPFLLNFNNLLNNRSKVQQRRFPLIVIEGLDGSGKSRVCWHLAQAIKGWRLCTPPRSVAYLREQFNSCPQIRTAFYVLSNYIAAMEIESVLMKRPVVLDRFWHSTGAFAIAQALADSPDSFQFPEVNDTIFAWPEDLLKPDIVFFLDVTEDRRLQRHPLNVKPITKQEKLLAESDDFRNNVLKAFRLMHGPGVTLINANLDTEQLIPKILSQLGPYLKRTRY